MHRQFENAIPPIVNNFLTNARYKYIQCKSFCLAVSCSALFIFLNLNIVQALQRKLNYVLIEIENMFSIRIKKFFGIKPMQKAVFLNQKQRLELSEHRHYSCIILL